MGNKFERNKKLSFFSDEVDIIRNKLGIDKNIDINDYLEFYRVFGRNDTHLYKKLKPIKDSSGETWNKISKIQVGDIDFNNGTIKFSKEKEEVR